MVEAIILLTAKPGFETKILELLRKQANIVEAYMVYGEYDLVLKVRADSIHELRDFIVNTLRKMDGVEKTITLIIAD